jgi:hypothetical protein
LQDLTTMWQEYAATSLALDPPVPLFPMVWPGFNDRTVTSVVHPVIPRELTSTATRQGGTYNEMWTIANQEVDSPAVVILNSFNDWRHDTQIEPIADNGDANGTTIPSTATGGFRYFPYQTSLVNVTPLRKGNVLLGAIYEVWYDDAPPDS